MNAVGRGSYKDYAEEESKKRFHFLLMGTKLRVLAENRTNKYYFKTTIINELKIVLAFSL
jgi:hypothetical protein